MFCQIQATIIQKPIYPSIHTAKFLCWSQSKLPKSGVLTSPTYSSGWGRYPNNHNSTQKLRNLSNLGSMIFPETYKLSCMLYVAYSNYIMHVSNFKEYFIVRSIKAEGGPLMFVILKVTEILQR